MIFGPALVSTDRAPTLVIGHRGAAGLRPENTLPSFARAAELGVKAVELDVHCVEGALVVIHDDTLERTTSGRGPVSACALAELGGLDAGGGARVPLLEEVFELLPPTVGINVELKGAGTAEGLDRFLRRHKYAERDVLVSSFDHQALVTFHRFGSGVAVAPLFHRWRADVWQVANNLSAWSVNLSVRIATRPRVAEAHERGYRVLVYTVNDLDIGRELVAFGVDGVFTDYPDRITTDSLGGQAPC